MCVCLSSAEVNACLKEHQRGVKKRGKGASTNKSLAAAPGVNRVTPHSCPGVSIPLYAVSKHSSSAGVTPNLSGRADSTPDQTRGAGVSHGGREREMNEGRGEMDEAMKRGQTLIDPGGAAI